MDKCCENPIFMYALNFFLQNIYLDKKRLTNIRHELESGVILNTSAVYRCRFTCYAIVLQFQRDI